MRIDSSTRFFVKDRRTFPALTDEEKAAILAKREPTKCPPVRLATTFHQRLSEKV